MLRPLGLATTDFPLEGSRTLGGRLVFVSPPLEALEPPDAPDALDMLLRLDLRAAAVDTMSAAASWVSRAN